jgi:urease accessory protein
MSETLWHLLQTSDSAFPVGGFAHSYGLEGMVIDGHVVTPADLASFIAQTWMPSLTHIDFPLVRLSMVHAMDIPKIFHLDETAHACRPTGEARKAQAQMGRKRLSTIAGLTGHPHLATLNREVEAGNWMANWPVVCGIEAAALSIPVRDALMSYAYQSIAGILAASTKLIRIGPAEAQRILSRQTDALNCAIVTSATVMEDDIGWFTPLLDIAGARHETAYTRLFIS